MNDVFRNKDLQDWPIRLQAKQGTRTLPRHLSSDMHAYLITQPEREKERRKREELEKRERNKREEMNERNKKKNNSA